MKFSIAIVNCFRRRIARVRERGRDEERWRRFDTVGKSYCFVEIITVNRTFSIELNESNIHIHGQLIKIHWYCRDCSNSTLRIAINQYNGIFFLRSHICLWFYLNVKRYQHWKTIEQTLQLMTQLTVVEERKEQQRIETETETASNWRVKNEVQMRPSNMSCINVVMNIFHMHVLIKDVNVSEQASKHIDCMIKIEWKMWKYIVIFSRSLSVNSTQANCQPLCQLAFVKFNWMITIWS